MSGNTVLWSSSIGDVSFPITPDSMDGVTIGETTPAPATVTDLHATGTTELDGAVSGAGFLAALLAWFKANAGTFVANGATPVTVAATEVTANSQILITLKTVGGDVGAIPHVETITPGTGFTVVGTASDASTYNYTVIG